MYPKKVFFAYQSSIESLECNPKKHTSLWWYDESILTPLKSVTPSLGATWVTGPGRIEAYNSHSAPQEYRILDDQIEAEVLLSHYQEYCRSALRPTLFNCLELQLYNAASWNNFIKVNLAYANTISRIAPHKSIAVILDYPLIMVPALLKRIRPDLYITYYHHAPFPHESISKSLSHFPIILRSLKQANQLIFRSKDSIRNFQDQSDILEKTTPNKAANIINIKDSQKITYAPFAHINQSKTKIDQNTNPRWTSTLQRLKEKRPILITIFDHLEEHTALIKVLEGIKLTLETRPELGSYFSILLFCNPSDRKNDHQQYIEKKVFELVARINGLYSQLNYPILSIYLSNLEKNALNAIYNYTDIFIANGLVNDYLPRVHEIAQQIEDNSKILLASRFIELEHIISPDEDFNPYDRTELSHKLTNIVIRQYHSNSNAKTRYLKAPCHYTVENWLDQIMQQWPMYPAKNHNLEQKSTDKARYRPVG